MPRSLLILENLHRRKNRRRQKISGKKSRSLSLTAPQFRIFPMKNYCRTVKKSRHRRQQKRSHWKSRFWFRRRQRKTEGRKQKWEQRLWRMRRLWLVRQSKRRRRSRKRSTRFRLFPFLHEGKKEGEIPMLTLGRQPVSFRRRSTALESM